MGGALNNKLRVYIPTACTKHPTPAPQTPASSYLGPQEVCSKLAQPVLVPSFGIVCRCTSDPTDRITHSALSSETTVHCPSRYNFRAERCTHALQTVLFPVLLAHLFSMLCVFMKIPSQAGAKNKAKCLRVSNLVLLLVAFK